MRERDKKRKKRERKSSLMKSMREKCNKSKMFYKEESTRSWLKRVEGIQMLRIRQRKRKMLEEISLNRVRRI